MVTHAVLLDFELVGHRATGSHSAIREVGKFLTKRFLGRAKKTATVRIAAYLLVIYGGPG